jgi:hypothetical protein
LLFLHYAEVLNQTNWHAQQNDEEGKCFENVLPIPKAVWRQLRKQPCGREDDHCTAEADGDWNSVHFELRTALRMRL